jgi:hypothetical protein
MPVYYAELLNNGIITKEQFMDSDKLNKRLGFY